MRVCIVAAVAQNGVIGRDNRLPWRLPADLRHFRSLTLGKPVIMGRRTFDSLGAPLKGRTNIILSRGHFNLPGVLVAGSLEAALVAAAGVDAQEAMVIGGAEIYRKALPRSQRIYLTRVGARVEGDVLFPPLVESEWKQVSREDHPADQANEYPYSYIVLDRV